jgi:hypothetical protein
MTRGRARAIALPATGALLLAVTAAALLLAATACSREDLGLDPPARSQRSASAPAPTSPEPRPYSPYSPPPALPDTAPAPVAPDVAELEASMQRLVEALDRRDGAGFLALFSRERSFRYVGTNTSPPEVTNVEYAELAADLEARQLGWWEMLFDAGDFECFRDHVKATGARPWLRQGAATFVPPDGHAAGQVRVTWRFEAGRWVVDEIAEPAT